MRESVQKADRESKRWSAKLFEVACGQAQGETSDREGEALDYARKKPQGQSIGVGPVRLEIGPEKYAKSALVKLTLIRAFFFQTTIDVINDVL